jgi:general secretion pathway protein G
MDTAMQQTIRSHKHKQGFSLVELLVVMAIIAILMGLVIGISSGVTRGAAEAQAKAQIAELMLEFDKLREDRAEYPDTGVGFAEFFTWYEGRYSGTRYTITDRTGNQAIDPWGRPYDYERISPFVIRVRSRGPDGNADTADDISNLKGSF